MERHGTPWNAMERTPRNAICHGAPWIATAATLTTVTKY